jgi:hypothetical protein
MSENDKDKLRNTAEALLSSSPQGGAPTHPGTVCCMSYKCIKSS